MLCALPIEIAIRELEGMLFLTLHLAAKGYPSLIGNYMVDRYVLKSKQPVCYFDMDQHEKTNKAILDAGGVVFNINPEGLSLLDFIESAEVNYAKVADYSTKMCMWGARQRDLIGTHLTKEQQDMLVVTGHPSFDLVSEKFISTYFDEDIEERYGNDFIMINTNYGYFNHEMGCDNYIRMLSKMDEWQMYKTDELKEYVNEISDYQKVLITETIELVKQLAKDHPDETIIVRPHPQENCEYYKTRLRGFENVHVTNKGSVRKWLASSKVLIHHDCTTGMEAMLMGIPVIQFRPIYNKAVTANLMIKIGHKTETKEEVSHLLANIDLIERKKHQDYVASFLANINKPAVESLTDLAVEYDNGEPAWIPTPLGFIDQIKCWRKHISKLIRQYQPGRNGRKVRYALNKFPRIPKSEIMETLQKLRKVNPDLPEVSVEQLCLNTFLIKPLNSPMSNIENDSLQ